MALDFDTTSAPGRPTERAALVAAIVAADPNDETDWLEWKSKLDLAKAEGRFAVARAILGLANRRVDHAQRVCEGHGFVVVGAEPGNVEGIDDVDPAVLDDWLSPYLGGSQGPRWSVEYVPIDGKRVLVVDVDPPRAGDPIFGLRKASERAHDGMVYVRRPGKTMPATSADLDYLSARLLQGSATSALSLELQVLGDLPLRWFDNSTVDAVMDEWLHREVAVQIAEAEQFDEERRRPKQFDDPARGGLVGLAAQMAEAQRKILDVYSLGTVDDRTLEQYKDEVGKWADKVRGKAMTVLVSRYLRQNAIRFVVSNPAERHLADLHVKVHVPGDVKGLDRVPDADFPSAPRPFGEGKQIAVPRFDNFPAVAIGDVRPPPGQWIENGSIHFRWNAGDLRPLEDEVSEDVFVLMTSEPEGDELVASWEATTPTVDGIVRGTVRIPVAPKPVTAAGLLA